MVWGRGLKNTRASTGVKNKASSSDANSAATMVRASDRKNTAVIPPKNTSGANTTMGVSVEPIKAGVSYGELDEIGFRAAVDRVSVHDLHATMLHLLGVDHKQLTYRYAGRDFRLTDVYGDVVSDLLV